jgi:DNA-binding IclR family transcriptional regulator
VERALGVSDATAERYLNQLEKEGKVKQLGRTGRYVCYIKK